MKAFATIVVLFLFIGTITASAQFNPADRPTWSRGVLLNFQEVSEGLEEIPILVVDCGGSAIFEPASNPSPVNKPDDFPFNSANVGKITTTACENEGIYLDKEYLLDFTFRPWIWVDVIPPAAGKKVLLVLEAWNDNTVRKEFEATTTVAGTWERLIFDVGGTESSKYGRIGLFFDYGGTAAGEVWYFDNVRQAQPPITYDNGVIEDFETPNRMFWGDWGNCEFSIVENPDTTGEVNKSKMVGQFWTTAEQWEGACNAERLYPLDFAAANGGSIKVKVYGPAGQRLMVKLENTINKTEHPIENPITLTLDYQWEEIEYDFTDLVFSKPEYCHSGFYDRIAIFPDFGSTIVGADWYIDDIVWTGQPTKVARKAPDGYELTVRNYPNPFNPTTTISYTLPSASRVQLAVYDLSGKRIASLVDGRQNAGAYDVQFDASSLPSGTYFYRLATEQQTITGKMLLIK